MPTVEMADYLYEVAERVMLEGEIPKSFIDHQNEEVASPILRNSCADAQQRPTKSNSKWYHRPLKERSACHKVSD
jgi:hypothetical protein